MMVISMSIHGVKMILNSGGKVVFLRGVPWNPPYALTEVRGTLCS